MKVLLDENFPLPLLEVLQADGLEAEHIITLGLRGISDSLIRARLGREPLLFVSQDTEFLTGPVPTAAWVLVSRVRQSRPLPERLDIWRRAVGELVEAPPTDRIIELTDQGALLTGKDSHSTDAD